MAKAGWLRAGARLQGLSERNDVTSADGIHRIAMLSVHTSPLEQPGTGDAGGMNVYVAEVARQLAARGREVEIFTRATTAAQPTLVEMSPGVLVRHVTAGPFEGLRKDDLPGQLCAFSAGAMRTEAARPEHYYDVIHSHYWLSGQVGWLAADRWRVPLVHTMHTMARVKNLHLAADDTPEPSSREIGEAQVVEAADRLVANTDGEARDLINLYEADPAKVRVVPPGVDLDLFRPGDQGAARAALGLPRDAKVVLFVGRIQPLKAPDVLLRATRELLARHPSWAGELVVGVLGGPSGTGLARPRQLEKLAAELGITACVRFVPPVDRSTLADWYRAADLVTVPSYNESFGPVVAADVGGLPFTVGDAGLLVPTHRTGDWADAIEGLLLDPARRADLSRRAVRHASGFGWDATTDRLLEVYAEARQAQTHAPIGDAGRLAGAATAVTP